MARLPAVRLPTTLLCAVVLGLSGCGQPPAPPAPAPASPKAGVPATAVVRVAPATPATSDVLVSYLDAWNRHDIDGVTVHFADDARYFDASTGNFANGRDDIEASVVSVLVRALPDLHRELRGEPVIDGDRIAYEWMLTGTNTGTWNGVPATRQKLRLGGATVMQLKNGRIAYEADYYDVSALNRPDGLAVATRRRAA